MTDMIELNNVGVTYPNGHTALQNVSGHLHSGKICGLVGVNGAGKSTLFKAIMGFVKPTTGAVKIMGQDVRAALKSAGFEIKREHLTAANFYFSQLFEAVRV